MSVIKTICALVFLVGFALSSTALLAEEGKFYSFKILEAATQKPLPDAIVRISHLDKNFKDKNFVAIADKSGVINFAFYSPAVVSVSYLGYAAFSDTFYSPISKQIFLEKALSNLEDVVVTGQYIPNTTKSSVYDVKVLTEKDFRNKGANNLREALIGEMNVDMTQDNVFGSGVSLQGISGEGVKIMVDGVPIVGRLDGKIDLSQINLSNIQRIEVVKGPLSVIYGTDALGGVINLITKSNQKEKFNVNLKGYYESVGQYNVELNGGVNIGKSQFYVSAGRNFFDGYSSKSYVRHQEWRPKEQYFADAKYVYANSKFKVSLIGSFFREHMIDRGDIHPNTTYAFDQHFITYRPRASAIVMVPLTPNSQLDAMLSYSGFFRFINSYAKDLVTLKENPLTDVLPDTATYHQITGRATYTLNTNNKKFSFQFGVDINQEFTKQQRIQDGRQQMGDYAAFGSIRWKPIPALDIQPSVRFAYNTRYRSPLVPSLNIKYDFKKYFTLRASYGLGYRAPSLKELYLTFKDSNHDINGNVNLKPEQGHSVTLAFDVVVSKDEHVVKISNTGFFNKIQNKIDLSLTDAYASPQVYTYFNLKDYMTYGGEHKIDYRWKRVNATAGVVYLKYDVRNSELTSDRASLFSPDVNVTLGYKIPKAEIGINVFYKYTGKKLLYTVNGSIQSGTRNAFHSLDVSLTRNFWKDRIQLTCGGKNLLGVTNVGAQGVSGIGHNFDASSSTVNWGRTFFVSLNLHFSK